MGEGKAALLACSKGHGAQPAPASSSPAHLEQQQAAGMRVVARLASLAVVALRVMVSNGMGWGSSAVCNWHETDTHQQAQTHRAIQALRRLQLGVAAGFHIC